MNDPTIATAINAGTPLALVQGAPTVLFPGGAPAPYADPVRVPQVQLAQADLASGRYAYVGVLKAGRDAATPVVSNTSYGYITSSVPTDRFVWVTTSGVVQGEAAVPPGPGPAAARTLDFAPASWNVGDFVFLSGTTPGAFVRDSDTFATGSTASELMTPIGIVGADTATGEGSMVVLPSRYGGSAVNDAKTEMFRGIGDYSSLRVGRSDGASVAGEQDGTVELCAIAGEAITAGDIVCISTNGGGVMQAFIADSSRSPDVANNKKYGIFGVAVQTVAITELGHFTVFGEANATLTGAAVGNVLYVGSSTAGLGNTAGTATIINRIDDTVPSVGDDLNYPAIPIPLGMYDGNKLILGIVEDPGIQALTLSTGRQEAFGTVSTNIIANTRSLGFNRANVYRYDGIPNDWASIDLPNTQSDSLMMTTSVYEDTLKGSDLYDITNQAIGGSVWLTPPAPQPDQDMPGATFENGVWVGTNGVPARPTNTFYGTFVLEDARYFEDLIPIAFQMHGYTDSHTANQPLQVKLEARVNYRASNTLGPFLEIDDEAFFETGNTVDTNSAFSVDFFSQVTSSNDVFYVPKTDASGNPFYSIDVSLIRRDGTNASLVVERLVLQALYLNKNVNLDNGFPPVVFEKKVPAYTLIDTTTSNFNIIDDGPAPGPGTVSHPTVGASMTNVGGRTLSTLTGFIPYDTRIDGANQLYVRILGKYMGTNAAASNIELDFTYEEIQAPNNYNASIAVAGVTQNLAVAPIATGAGDYSMIAFDFAIPNPASSTSCLRFLIERVTSGASAPIPIVGETSFQISNIYVQSDLQDTYGALEDIYEDKTSAADVVDIDNALNLNVDTDFAGFLFPGGGGTETLYIPIKVDKRYDYRENIYFEVFGYVDTANATPVGLNLGVSNFYDHEDLSPQTGAAMAVVQNATTDISAAIPAGEVKFISHPFVLSAKDVWNFGASTLEPDYTQFRNSGNATTLFKLTRSDTNGVDFTVMGIRAFTRSGKKSGAENLCANISEGIDDPQYSYLNVLTSYRADSPYLDGAFKARTLLASAHRHYFQYAINNAAIPDGDHEEVHPIGTSPGRAYGWLVPFNMAIVGVYGYGDDGGAQPVPAGVQIEVYLQDQAGNSLAGKSGVIGMPMETSSVVGGWRWTGNPLNFNVPTATSDLHTLPLIYLPTNYSSSGWNAGPPPVPAPYAGDMWLLSCTAHNNSGGAIDLTANITVEVVLLPTHDVAD